MLIVTTTTTTAVVVVVLAMTIIDALSFNFVIK